MQTNIKKKPGLGKIEDMATKLRVIFRNNLMALGGTLIQHFFVKFIRKSREQLVPKWRERKIVIVEERTRSVQKYLSK